MSNHLALENSPYLLQHADNPVDWFPWGPEALEKARQEDKPIFLSIGYAACHWCHVMAHESFEDPHTAELMNAWFVNIKVDREERPDIDNIYMQAVVAMTGQGGWPLSVFLTPAGQPFYGGTYFPPEPRYRMPSFRDVLASVARVWQEDRQNLLASAEKISAHLQQALQSNAPGAALDPQTLEQASEQLTRSYDRQHGGWGQAPKFPQPMAIEFLLRQATRGDQEALTMAQHALDAMGRGGMYDVVGGGFARYSVDSHWLVPHFEKMLYDNAQLARVYLQAFLLSRQEFYRRVCTETIDFVLRELRDPLGGFYSSLDADSEGKEGKFYLWTPAQIEAALDDPDDYRLLVAAYGITEAGNFEGHSVLQRAQTDAHIAAGFDLAFEQVPEKLTQLHARLLKARAERVRPATDDKVLVSWNGLMLVALAEAARYLERDDYLQAAQQNADFLLTAMRNNGRLLRSWRAGQASHNAYLEDYAALILGLLALYQGDHDPRWYQAAHELAETMLAHYRAPQGGFFDTADDHEELLVRPKDVQDNAMPSGNALAALALLQLAAYSGNSEWRNLAEESIGSMQDFMLRYPTGFAQWLNALDFALGPVQEVALVGKAGAPDLPALQTALWSTYRPRLVAACAPDGQATETPPLLANRPVQNQQATAYVCQGFVCQRPVNTAVELLTQLSK